MAAKNIEIRVGLIIIASLIIFVGTVLWIQGYRYGQENIDVYAIFDEVGSLSKGDPVMISGLRKGKVQQLTLNERGVLVEFTITSDVRLKEDATATVKNIGLMGERFLAVTPGKSETDLDLINPIVGSYDTGIPEVMGMMGEMITELRNLVLSIKHSIASEDNLTKLSGTISNMERVTESLADYMERNGDKLDQSAQNFLTASQAFRKIAVNNEKRIDTLMGDLSKSVAGIDSVVADLAQVAATARAFADNLENGDGTLQLLVDDRRLYDDLRRAASNIDDLIKDIRSNPRKYINFTVELF
jgi:phospholipid/cholesterol/gamma-HCH transport system substrate-binding protein